MKRPVQTKQRTEKKNLSTKALQAVLGGGFKLKRTDIGDFWNFRTVARSFTGKGWSPTMSDPGESFLAQDCCQI